MSTPVEISLADRDADGNYHRKSNFMSADLDIVPRIGEILKLDYNDSTDNYRVVGVVHDIAYDRGRNTQRLDLLVVKAV